MISIILTIHNKGWLLKRVLDGIRDNISEVTKQLIFVLDGCTDNSEEILMKYALENFPKKMYRIHLADDVFEVKANNIGLKDSNQPYCMIIQDDMVIEDKYFDSKLLCPFEEFSDVFAVSARTAHDNIIKDGVVQHINISGKDSNLEKWVFSVRDSCNRGPLLLKHDSLEKLNYLDERFAPLHLDDHDICMRAWKELGQVSGSYMIDYRSDLEWGSTRNPKIAKLSNDSWHKNSKLMIEKHYDALVGEKHGEERKCLYVTQA